MQTDPWLSGEGNAYFQRNRAHYTALPEDDVPLRLIELNAVPTDDVLEVGCCTGSRLAALAQRNPAGYFAGVDPSVQAISAGRQLWPGLHLEVGTALSLDPEAFGLVIVNFVLHWVARESLLDSVACVDGAVREGGYLLLGDFLPDEPTAVPYKHRAGLYTYKLDYPALFLASGLYREVDRLLFDHDSRAEGNAPPDRRAVCVLLRKESMYR